MAFLFSASLAAAANATVASADIAVGLAPTHIYLGHGALLRLGSALLLYHVHAHPPAHVAKRPVV